MRQWTQVYPRVCGGAALALPTYPIHSGLSPRVRGSHRQTERDSAKHGSIPACAGEPGCRLSCMPQWRVYPRVCGGAPRRGTLCRVLSGLSPRVRGSLFANPQLSLLTGSIPACAGEPHFDAFKVNGARVYPRVCGGAYFAFGQIIQCGGLSPRVRGSQVGARGDDLAHGSIPACAGEPPDAAGAGLPQGVYPRVCGGAVGMIVVGAIVAGLSPRVRGSLARIRHQSNCWGSIPACAGEPCPARPWRTLPGVYPRVCGGARVDPLPRRGGRVGSIPACAGEPGRRRGARRRIRVYPRVCGGASASRSAGVRQSGLSPRVRGSPHVRPAGLLPVGSIPACAGEPGRAAWTRSRVRVYPRVCGGADRDGLV